jgi:hypothetical protein
MADVRVLPDVKISDATTPSQQVAVDASGRLSVNLTASSATVTVDTELPAAAALSDTTGNPTTAMVGAANMVWDGTNWVRHKGAATLADALANPGAGLAQNQIFAMGFNGTTWDRIRTANTGRLQVDVITGGGGTPANILVDNNAFTDGTSSVGVVGYIFDETAGTALTENDTAAARIDTKRAQVHVLEDATTRGQRQAVDSSGRASVSLTASSATVTVDTELPAAAALSDTTGNPTTSMIGSAGMLWDGTTNWIRAKSAATLADALANPGAGLAQNQVFAMGFNGTTWDRVRTANTGRLQVDVITGGGSPAAPTAPIPNYNTSASLAAGSTSNHDSADFGAATKAVYQVILGASVPMKGELQYVDNGTPTTLATFFTQAGNTDTFIPAHTDFWKHTFTANAGFDGFRLIRTNLDASEAADVYSAVMHAG